MARIVIVASLASSLVRFRGDLIQTLLSRGHTVHTAAPAPDEKTVNELSRWGVGVTSTPLARAGMNPLADLAYLRCLSTLIREHRPDLVMAYTPKPVIYSGIACRRLGVRHVGLISGLGYGFGSESAAQRLLGRLLTVLFRYGLRISHRVIFQNPDDLDLFVQGRIVDRSRTCLVSGSGVDSHRFSPVPLPKRPVFLLMARLIPEKGVREYVAAAREVRLKVPDAKFLLAGWTEPRRGSISARELAEWQQSGDVEYLGALEDVRPAIAQAGVYVLPSYYREGVPRSLLEAMSMGRAIITTDMPGCRETVRDGSNGVLVPARRGDVLADAMLRMAMAPNEVARMGARSRSIVEERFTVERVNSQMMAAMGL